MGPPSQFANPEGTVPDLHTMQQRFVNQDSPTAFTSLQILVSWLQNPRNKPREEERELYCFPCSLHFWRPPLRQVPATLQPEIEEWHLTNLDPDQRSTALGAGILPDGASTSTLDIWLRFPHQCIFPHHLDSWQLSFSQPRLWVLSALMWKSLQFHADFFMDFFFMDWTIMFRNVLNIL